MDRAEEQKNRENLRLAIAQNNSTQFSKTLDRLLADKSFDLNGVDRYERTLLSYAAEDGQLTVINILLDRGENIDSSDCPLHLAVEYATLRTIDLLLDRGANIDRLNDRGCTPLSLAAGNGDEEVMLRLIERGANINIANCLGLKPIHYALARNINKAIDALNISQLDAIEERLFLETYPSLIIDTIDRSPSPELLDLKQQICNSDSPLLILVNFFSLPQVEQAAILPRLDKVTKFDFRDGDVVTDSSLDVIGCGYQQLLSNLAFSLEDEREYPQSIFRTIGYAASNISGCIYMAIETSQGDNYFEDNALSSDLFLVVRYISRFIRSCLDIDRPVSTLDLQKSIDYYLHP